MTSHITKVSKFRFRFCRILLDEIQMSDDQRPDANLLNKEFETPFDNPKQLSFMERIVSISDDDAVVLDFFAGSATTAHAVMNLNLNNSNHRKHIMIQLPEHCSDESSASMLGYGTICDVSEERIRRAGNKLKAELEESNAQLKLGEEPKQLPDIGFRVFELDESGIAQPDNGELLLDVVKPDRSDLDIVFEMMLKWGLELTLPIEKEEIAGYPIWNVAYGELICCLAKGLTSDVLIGISEMEPRRVLILDQILDDSLKLNALKLFEGAKTRTGQEIELRTV